MKLTETLFWSPQSEHGRWVPQSTHSGSAQHYRKWYAGHIRCAAKKTWKQRCWRNQFQMGLHTHGLSGQCAYRGHQPSMGTCHEDPEPDHARNNGYPLAMLFPKWRVMYKHETTAPHTHTHTHTQGGDKRPSHRLEIATYGAADDQDLQSTGKGRARLISVILLLGSVCVVTLSMDGSWPSSAGTHTTTSSIPHGDGSPLFGCMWFLCPHSGECWRSASECPEGNPFLQR